MLPMRREDMDRWIDEEKKLKRERDEEEEERKNKQDGEQRKYN